MSTERLREEAGDVERWTDFKCGHRIGLINGIAHEWLRENKVALLNREEKWRETEGMRAGRGGHISSGAFWPCIVMDWELNFDCWVIVWLGLVTNRRFMTSKGEHLSMLQAPYCSPTQKQRSVLRLLNTVFILLFISFMCWWYCLKIHQENRFLQICLEQINFFYVHSFLVIS